jgi:hypothetical protein
MDGHTRLVMVCPAVSLAPKRNLKANNNRFLRHHFEASAISRTALSATRIASSLVNPTSSARR